MPRKPTVRGIPLDASGAPVIGGKTVATLKGSGVFDGGTRIVTNRNHASAGQDRHRALELVDDGDGDSEGAKPFWLIGALGNFANPMRKAAGLFLAPWLSITLDDPKQTGAKRKNAAPHAGFSCVPVVNIRADDDALRAAPKHSNDLISAMGV